MIGQRRYVTASQPSVRGKRLHDHRTPAAVRGADQPFKTLRDIECRADMDRRRPRGALVSRLAGEVSNDPQVARSRLQAGERRRELVVNGGSTSGSRRGGPRRVVAGRADARASCRGLGLKRAPLPRSKTSRASSAALCAGDPAGRCAVDVARLVARWRELRRRRIGRRVWGRAGDFAKARFAVAAEHHRVAVGWADDFRPAPAASRTARATAASSAFNLYQPRSLRRVRFSDLEPLKLRIFLEAFNYMGGRPHIA